MASHKSLLRHMSSFVRDSGLVTRVAGVASLSTDADTLDQSSDEVTDDRAAHSSVSQSPVKTTTVAGTRYLCRTSSLGFCNISLRTIFTETCCYRTQI